MRNSLMRWRGLLVRQAIAYAGRHRFPQIPCAVWPRRWWPCWVMIVRWSDIYTVVRGEGAELRRSFPAASWGNKARCVGMNYKGCSERDWTVLRLQIVRDPFYPTRNSHCTLMELGLPVDRAISYLSGMAYTGGWPEVFSSWAGPRGICLVRCPRSYFPVHVSVMRCLVK